MRVAIELDCEQICDLVFNELEATLNQFQEDVELDNPAIFSMNDTYDKILIQKHIEALELILDWYRVP